MRTNVGLSFFIALLFAHGQFAEAQPVKIPRIGFLSSSGNRFAFDEFRKGLAALGYVEGKNIVIEFRAAEGKQDQIPGLLNELVQLKIDVLVSTSQVAIERAKQTIKTIPVVIVATFDPVETGLIESLARPGANITGVSMLQRELSGKRLELLREVVPNLSRVGALWDPIEPGPVIGFKEYETTARAFKITLQSLELRGPNPDFEGAFSAATRAGSNALITIANSLMNRNGKQIADLAIKHRLPSMYERSDYVEAGGLVSYAADNADTYRRAAYFVDRILKGTKPADLPVEQPMKFELVFNLKTAKQIGITIPQWTLMKADRVIR